MKHTLIDKLPSAVISFALAVLVSAGAVYSHRRPEPDSGQAITAAECVKLHPLIETPAHLETIPAGTPPTESVPAEPKSEPPTSAPEYITTLDFETYSFIPLSADLQSGIQAVCAEYEIAYDLVLAITKTESEFDTAAIGDSGNAYGLMQIQPRWWEWLAAEKGLTDYRTDPAQNAALGTAILSLLLTENGGDLNKALIAYNGGADYPKRVYANYAWIRRQKGEPD